MDPLTKILFQQYQQDLSYMPIQPTLREGYDQPSENFKLSELSAVNMDFSALSRQLGAFSKTLAGNKAAEEGITKFVFEFGKNPNKTEFLQTFVAMKDLQTNNPESFTETFETAGRISEIGGPVSPFLQTAGNLVQAESKLYDSFLSETNNIISSEGSVNDKKDTLGGFFAAINATIGNPEGDGPFSGIEDLFTGMSEAKTLDEKNDFLRTNGTNK